MNARRRPFFAPRFVLMFERTPCEICEKDIRYNIDTAAHDGVCGACWTEHEADLREIDAAEANAFEY